MSLHTPIAFARQPAQNQNQTRMSSKDDETVTKMLGYIESDDFHKFHRELTSKMVLCMQSQCAVLKNDITKRITETVVIKKIKKLEATIEKQKKKLAKWEYLVGHLILSDYHAQYNGNDVVLSKSSESMLRELLRDKYLTTSMETDLRFTMRGMLWDMTEDPDHQYWEYNVDRDEDTSDEEDEDEDSDNNTSDEDEDEENEEDNDENDENEDEDRNNNTSNEDEEDEEDEDEDDA